MEATGYKKWIIPDGHIPFKSTGREPDFLSQDKIAVLNLNDEPAILKLTIFYREEEPVEGFTLEVKGRRVRKFRVNDLINPFPVILEKDYSIMIESDKPVIVQFLRMNTGNRNLALMGTMAYRTDK